MTTIRLDRLSALLDGLNPKVTVGTHGDGFSLHIINGTSNEERLAFLGDSQLESLCLLACPSGHPRPGMIPGGERCHLSFSVAFEGPMGPGFLAEFSRPILIKMKDADPSLLQVVGLIANELQTQRCGQPSFISLAGDMLLIGMMRHLISRPQQLVGLFSALSDARIAKSLVAMQTDPAHPWTLEVMATHAGMSRTSFATCFKRVMQVPPGKYLENLRLAIARQMVHKGNGLKQVAKRTGYSSPSTLSRALGRASQQLPVQQMAPE